jgi:hypothetical protein
MAGKTRKVNNKAANNSERANKEYAEGVVKNTPKLCKEYAEAL